MHEGEVVGYAKCINGLYVVKTEPNGSSNTNAKVSAVVKSLSDSRLWHQRFAHLGYDNLQKVQGMVSGMDGIRIEHPDEICNGCMMGRQEARISRVPVPRAKEYLEKVHIDLMGPLDQSFVGHRYIMSLKDDATGLIFCLPLKAKNKAYPRLVQWVTENKNQSGKRLKKLYYDNRKEFNTNPLDKYCKDRGIIQEFSAPYAHEQNGKAERNNRTILYSVRSILHAIGLPKSL